MASPEYEAAMEVAGSIDTAGGRIALALEQAKAVALNISAGEERVRINHTFTAKDGWRLNDTTAEVTAPNGEPHYSVVARNRRRQLMREAFIDGWQEAEYRNANPNGEDMPDEI